ncbi:hypothetical protein ACHQM5_007999 [Ranunculus cassubicifolius]
MRHFKLISLLSFIIFFTFFTGTEQLQTSQTQLLYQIRIQLEYPKPLELWSTFNGDFCNSPQSPQLNLTCENNFITQLKIIGNFPSSSSSTITEFDGVPILNQTLSYSFSIDSFVTTLSRLSSLRVLTLVSLGIWGSLPDKIHRLSSLESLDLSSNFLYGSIPSRMSTMLNLQILRLDDNFFNNTVPSWVDSLSNLTILSLRSNQLKGSIPNSVGKLKSLTELYVSNNRISGKLFDLSNLTSLHVLDLRDNRIDSALPIMPRGLVICFLSKNSFSGEIPQEFVELSQLQQLDLSFNFLRGKPPTALFSLWNISYLNLASNMLSGSLPKNLDCGNALGFVDISINRLSGELPSCLSSTLPKRVVKFGGNCLSVDPLHQNNASYCKIEGKRRVSRGKSLGVVVGVIGGVVLLLLLVVIAVFYRKYCCRRTSEQRLLPKTDQDKPPTVFPPEFFANARFISQTTKLGTQGIFKYRLFSIEELNEATNNFDQSEIIGEGSRGKLYKGRLGNGTFVAIRCLTLHRKDSLRTLKLQLDLLSKLHHPNLVFLLGHSIDDSGQDTSPVKRAFLIYEYVSNGNLHTHLSENSSEKALKWPERLSVLIGIAKAVHFLHTGITPGFFNNRLRTNSILLDEHGIAKLSDYGLSIITEEMNKPEVKGERKKLWKKPKLEDDVYSFGLILYETLVGSTSLERGEAFRPHNMALLGSQDGQRDMVEPIVLSTSCEESLSVVISIMNKCMLPEVSIRPSFEDVLWNLQYAAQVQATSDGDQRLDISS